MGTNKYGGICDAEIADAKIYRLWYGILRRCYDGTQLARDRGKAYAGCTVCDDWHVYSNFEKDVKTLAGFAQWYEGNDMQLDKDILGNGKEYNRRNCCFVPRSVNTAYMDRKHPDITKKRMILTKSLMCCEKMVKHLCLNQRKTLANTLESQNVQWHRAIGEEQSAKGIP